jgi:RNA polymerase sporulation-specific sigma factor
VLGAGKMDGPTLYKENPNKLLKDDEVKALIKKSKAGDKEALNILVSNNLGLVKSIVKRFLNRGYEAEDLFQLGCIGLVKAVENFDCSYDVRFSTYAVPMIIGEIKRFLRDDGIIKVSRSLKEVYNKTNRAKEKLTKEFNREPSIQEIAEEIGVTSEDVVMALDAKYTPEYLHDIVHQDDGAPIMLIDRIGNDSEDEGEIVEKIVLKQLLNQLKQRERQIIILRYFQDKTQTEIAEQLGISQVQVSRIEKKILAELKSKILG